MKIQTVREGRFVEQPNKVETAIDQLKLGMYVSELDRPWEETPFVLQGFHIRALEEIDQIAEYCKFVYIDKKESIWLEPVERAVSTISKNASVTTYRSSDADERRTANALYGEARELTSSFLHEARLGKALNVKEVKRTVSDIVKSVLRNPQAMEWISRIRDKDAYTSEHSLNVGILAINYGRHLGLGTEDLNDLGVAGMLHDVGKMRIPDEILNKPGSLTTEEIKIMQEHAKFGRDILLSQQDLFHGAVDVAYSHHEAMNGTGYPRRLEAKSITKFTRIVSLCDVYDAITSQRLYSAARTSQEALSFVYKQRDGKFDADLGEKFIEYVGLYPSGSIVELTNGEIGIVISTNYKNRHLPRVLVIRDPDKREIDEKIVDLEKQAAKANDAKLIKNILANGSHGIRIEKYIERGLDIR